MKLERLAQLFEEHIRAAFLRAEGDFPAFRVDSWTDPAVLNQWVVVEDDDGRRSQAHLTYLLGRGASIGPGRLAEAAGQLVDSVLDGLRKYAVGDGPIVSRPLPDLEGQEVAWFEFRGVWFRLSVGPREERTVAVLAALLGRDPTPLVEPDESVTWL